MLVVINDVLDFSKIEENKLSLESLPFSLRNTIEEALEVVSVDASKKNIELLYDLDFETYIMGDPIRLRQILVNLLSNATKFSPKNGEVIVQAEVEDVDDESHRILFSVRDSGIGISTDAQQIVFEPFKQADISITRQFGGLKYKVNICNTL